MEHEILDFNIHNSCIVVVKFNVDPILQGKFTNLNEARALAIIIKNMKMSSRKKTETFNDKVIQKAILNDPRTTTGLASANWRKWVQYLTYRKVAATQEKCIDMMVLMGYNEVQQDTLLNSTSLLKKFCPNRNITFCSDDP